MRIRFATFLAPSVYPSYLAVTEWLGHKLGVETDLVVGERFEQFASGEVDAGFICGLPYVHLTRHNPAPVELLAAPVLLGERYGGRPIYFSDVIVRHDSPFATFDELRGRSWSYNDLDSHSGYNLTRYHLVSQGETNGYFGRVFEAGFHQESIRLVREGEIDASAIDSQVLAIAMRDDPSLAEDIRIIGALGPSTIQPVVASSRLPDTLKADLRYWLLCLGDDPQMAEVLAGSLFARYVPVTDGDYDDIREMLAAAERADFLTLR